MNELKELVRLLWPFVAIYFGVKLGRKLLKDWIPAIKMWFQERTM